MDRFSFIICIWIGLSLFAGCSDVSFERTLEANHAAGGTQLAQLRMTGTVQIARMNTTLEFSQTRVALAATRSAFLQATLVDFGMSEAALGEFRTQQFRLRQVQPTATPIGIEATAGNSNGTPPTLPPPANFTPTVPDVTPLALLFTPTPLPDVLANPDAPRLENPVTALGVGQDDCAVNITAQFAPTTAEIYVVATAVNIASGTRLTSRWLFGGEQQAAFSFTPDFDIERACIWFFVDQSDFEFVPGQWSVVLDINGQAAIDPLTFNIAANG